MSAGRLPRGFSATSDASPMDRARPHGEATDSVHRGKTWAVARDAHAHTAVGQATFGSWIPLHGKMRACVWNRTEQMTGDALTSCISRSKIMARRSLQWRAHALVLRDSSHRKTLGDLRSCHSDADRHHMQVASQSVVGTAFVQNKSGARWSTLETTCVASDLQPLVHNHTNYADELRKPVVSRSHRRTFVVVLFMGMLLAGALRRPCVCLSRMAYRHSVPSWERFVAMSLL